MHDLLGNIAELKTVLILNFGYDVKQTRQLDHNGLEWLANQNRKELDE